MDREKIIDGLRHCLPETIIDGLQDCNTCPYQRDCETDATVSFPIRMIEEIRSLLKEQEVVEAKQVIRKQCKKEHDDGSIDYFAEWYCPHCNMLILRGFDNPSIKFCYKCGGPVLWESR